MLNKPKFMSPSINMYGSMVVDLKDTTLPFSCIVDGDEAITHWQIVISRLGDNSIVYDSGKKERETPFYPINNRNQNVVFCVDLKENPTQTSDNNFVNSENPYYWKIIFWGKTGNEVSSSEEVFYANSTPKTTLYYSYDNKFVGNDKLLRSDLILPDKASLSKRKIYFKADYVQAEGIHIKRYGWRITDTSNNFVVVDTISQNQVYGVDDDISCECNGLLNNTNCLLELYVETQNGYFGILNTISFDVAYPVTDIEADFDIVALDRTSGIMLNWGNLKTTEGVVEGGDVSYVQNLPISNTDRGGFHENSKSIVIPRNSRVVFSETANGKALDIDENSYVVLSFQVDKDVDVVILEMYGVDDTFNTISRKLHYDHATNDIVYTAQKGNIVVSSSVKLSNVSGETGWYVATLSPFLFDNGNYYATLNLSENIAEEALFPEEELYPDEECFPEIGTWNKVERE